MTAAPRRSPEEAKRSTGRADWSAWPAYDAAACGLENYWYPVGDAEPHPLSEHSADPFASPHTPTLRCRFNAAHVQVIKDGKVPLEATATAFASALLAVLEEPSSLGRTGG